MKSFLISLLIFFNHIKSLILVKKYYSKESKLAKVLVLRNGLFITCETQNSNQIFHYTRCNTPKRVTSWRGPSPRHCARATQLLSKKWRRGGEPLATLCFDLNGPRFEPQTSRFTDERVTARPMNSKLNPKICLSH